MVLAHSLCVMRAEFVDWIHLVGLSWSAPRIHVLAVVVDCRLYYHPVVEQLLGGEELKRTHGSEGQTLCIVGSPLSVHLERR